LGFDSGFEFRVSGFRALDGGSSKMLPSFGLVALAHLTGLEAAVAFSRTLPLKAQAAFSGRSGADMEHIQQDQRRAEHCASLALLALGLCLGDAQAQPNSSGQAAISGPNAPLTEPGAASAALAQWRAELAELGTTNTPAAVASLSAWLDKLLAGQLAKELQLELLEAAGKQSAPAIKERLERFQAARLEVGGMACSSDLLYGGNAERGRKIFLEKKEAVCIKCHKVGHEGGDTGPPLTGATTNRTREFILESILLPDAQITPGYETYSVVLKDRSSVHGIIKRESETVLIIECPPDEENWEARLVTIQKANIASRRKTGSAMPDGLDHTLSRRELRDLIEFVAGLK
jgi:putative heme-binding domain-containing protein